MAKTLDKFNINILGYNVNVVKTQHNGLSREQGGDPYYCLYAILPNSQYLHSSFLSSYCTFRGTNYKNDDDDTVGVDTNHGYNWGMAIEDKLKDGMSQITDIIRQYNHAVKGIEGGVE